MVISVLAHSAGVNASYAWGGDDPSAPCMYDGDGMGGLGEGGWSHYPKAKPLKARRRREKFWAHNAILLYF